MRSAPRGARISRDSEPEAADEPERVVIVGGLSSERPILGGRSPPTGACRRPPADWPGPDSGPAGSGTIGPVNDTHPTSTPAGNPPRIRPVTAGGDWTTRRLLAWMAERFEASGVEPPRLVAEMLLAHVIGCDRMRLYMEADRPADADELTTLRDLVKRASGGTPVQYLTGTGSFFGRDFLVDASTLIPQPCTEELVAIAIRHLRPERASVFDRFDLQRLDALLEETAADHDEPGGEGHAPGDGDDARRDDDSAAVEPGPLVADVGTGTGCIAISVALSVPAARIVATDIAPEALDLARRNAERFGVGERIEFIEGDMLAPLEAAYGREAFDAILSNPPYIPDTEWDGGAVEASVRDHVPARALRGGADGTDLLRPLLRGAPQLLKPGGRLAVECASAHANTILEWAGLHPRLEGERLHEDGDGLPRIVDAVRPIAGD